MASVESRKERSATMRVDKVGNAPQEPRRRSGLIGLAAITLFAVGLAAGLSGRWWWPALVASGGDQHAAHDDEPAEAGSEPAAPATAGHNHAAGTSLLLSEQGRQNIGLTLETVRLQDFSRTVSMPATVTERPGQTELAVSAPMTGIVTRIYRMRGEAILPADPLFDLRLTHEDLVEKQSSLLRSLEELDVVKREVTRLDDVTASGAVAGKRLLEREYEQQRIEANIRAEQQALLLHGLTDEQIRQIGDTRQLLQSLTIVAPPPCDKDETDDHIEYLQMAEIGVKLGEHVSTGTQLATVTDHCELLIEGKAFEQDAEALTQAANDHSDVTALITTQGAQADEVPGLRILYVENRVERDSRALKFYLRLPNELVRNEEAGGHRFIGWRYRPGQRVELRVPIDRWEKRIVLPIQSVIQEGPESYVYLRCEDHFERRPVHVEYRDQRSAVIANDGTLFPGDQVAAQGAYQIHLAAKNQAGGGPDPHAGHQH